MPMYRIIILAACLALVASAAAMPSKLDQLIAEVEAHPDVFPDYLVGECTV